MTVKNHGPWKIKSSEVKYRNPWMEVREDQVIQPDGKDSIYGVITSRDGVSVLPMDEEGFVYLNKEFKYALGTISTETMSGGVEPGEAPLDAAKRELQEEYGMSIGEWTSLGVSHAFTSTHASAAYLYLARQLSINGATSHEGMETLEVIRIPFAEAVAMVMDSRITHGQSCVLILKAARYLATI